MTREVWQSIILLQLPFPSTQVKNDEARVLVAVDVVKKTYCRGSEFIVNVLPWMLPCNMNPCLYELTENFPKCQHIVLQTYLTHKGIDVYNSALWKCNERMTYAFLLIRLKAVHIVGSSNTPGTQEFQEIDFNRCLHKDKVVLCHPKTTEKERPVTDMLLNADFTALSEC